MVRVLTGIVDGSADRTCTSADPNRGRRRLPHAATRARIARQAGCPQPAPPAPRAPRPMRKR